MVRRGKRMEIYQTHKNVSMKTCPNVVDEWNYVILTSVAELRGKIQTDINYCRFLIYGNMDYGIFWII